VSAAELIACILLVRNSHNFLDHRSDLCRECIVGEIELQFVFHLCYRLGMFPLAVGYYLPFLEYLTLYLFYHCLIFYIKLI
jgi:hypothetical protein